MPEQALRFVLAAPGRIHRDPACEHPAYVERNLAVSTVERSQGIVVAGGAVSVESSALGNQSLFRDMTEDVRFVEGQPAR